LSIIFIGALLLEFPFDGEVFFPLVFFFTDFRRLSTIAEKTLAEFLAKATSCVVDGIPLPGMKVRRKKLWFI
jgi:hypothetical protein